MSRHLSRTLGSMVTVAALLGATAATASPIEFIYTGIGSGSIGGKVFDRTSFSIFEFADTSNLQSCGALCQFIDADTTMIDIAGVGVFNFTTGTRTFDNNGRVGLSRAGVGGSDLYNVFQVGDAYDMISSIGPIFGTAFLIQWGFPPVVTDGGTLIFDFGPSEGSFQAIAGTVPEPVSIALVGLALAGLGATRSRKGSAL